MRDWDLQRIAGAVGAHVHRQGTSAAGPFRATVDSRGSGPGDLFVGLRGEHTDGGAHAGAALEAGAWGVLVSPAYADVADAGPGGAILAHPDPLAAMQTLAREVGPEDIRVNIVLPGFVPGPNTDEMFARQAEQRGTTVDDVLAHYAKDTALRRLPTPDDLADAVVFLASDHARSITGQTLDVNSGVWMA